MGINARDFTRCELRIPKELHAALKKKLGSRTRQRLPLNCVVTALLYAFEADEVEIVAVPQKYPFMAKYRTVRDAMPDKKKVAVKKR